MRLVRVLTTVVIGDGADDVPRHGRRRCQSAIEGTGRSLRSAVFGSGLGSGSTIGPDGALYVTDGNAGKVWRIDAAVGRVTKFADGLPPQGLGIGGAMDIAFIGHTAYVLVTMVGGDIVGGPHIGDDTVGIYRLNRDGSFTVIADIGAWSAAHPPATDYFITTGVQYAMQPVHRGFLVTDGHHNRVLRVSLDGAVSEAVAFGNIVPTGLEMSGNRMYMSQLGPAPHFPQDGRVITFPSRGAGVREVARGASMLVDVELGSHHTLYALSQGDWDGVAEGPRRSPTPAGSCASTGTAPSHRCATARATSSSSTGRRPSSSSATPLTSSPSAALSSRSRTSSLATRAKHAEALRPADERGPGESPVTSVVRIPASVARLFSGERRPRWNAPSGSMSSTITCSTSKSCTRSS